MTSFTKSRVAIVFATYTLTDPTTRNTIRSISKYFDKVVVVLQSSDKVETSLPAANVVIEEVKGLNGSFRFFGLTSFFNWVRYKKSARIVINNYKPSMIVTFMLRPLAAVSKRKSCTLISCVYDIPDAAHAGKLDRRINTWGFKRIREADLVWASDNYKARLVMNLGKLSTKPLVCYNCPDLGYTNQYDSNEMRQWLRLQLKMQGAEISSTGGSILIRAGAIGVYCGIEETLEAMTHLPNDYLFLMMGRPTSDFKLHLENILVKYGMQNRAFLWDRVNDDTWTKAIFGADIGHLVHIPPPTNSTHAGTYNLNSSLSNYRLFFYMAAGLPILSYDDSRLDDIHKEVDCFKILKTSQLVQETIVNWDLLAQDMGLSKKLSENAKEAFQLKYNWETQFEKIDEFVDYALNG